ncbi:MAG: SLC13 family permease [Pseudomonadota bacterium]
MFDIVTQFQLPEQFHMWFTIAIIVMAIIFYANDKVSMEITSIVILATLMVFFYFFPMRDAVTNEVVINTEKLLLGFSNPAMISVISLLILGQAVVQTGALSEVSNLIMRVSRDNAMIAISLSLIFVIAISAILNNTPVVVIFIPIISALAKRINMSNSKVMIPLSYAAVMGGMLTLIGSSTNLLVSAMLVDLGLPELGFFEFSIPGLFLSSVAIIYILFIAPRLLSDRTSMSGQFASGTSDTRQFIAQVNVDYTSDLIGQNIEQGNFPNYDNINLKMLQRGEHAYLPPFESNMSIRAGDIIVISATKKELTKFISEKPYNIANHIAATLDNAEDITEGIENMNLAEIIVAPASRMIGRTLEQIAFHHTNDCVVLGIQRQSRIIRARVTEIRLAAGDVLLIIGKRENILSLHSNSDIMLMEWSTEEIHSNFSGVKAGGVFFAVAGLAAFDVLPITISAFAGVAAIILLKCINLRQAARAVDFNIILMISASLALGTAMQYTGAAYYLAHELILLLDGMTPVMIMSMLFLLMMFITNILSNNASAVLFTPIAVSVAAELQIDPTMFIYAVIFACNCSFITPIGYQTNLLVMAPGNYKFSDFIKAGLPLGLLMWASYTLFCILYPDFFTLK